MIKFLSNGDYVFPFDFLTYWEKHFYMWSFQSGTPNPDGIIRLPGRILNFIVFGLFGNEAIGYFYVISSLVIAFLAFFFFVRHFLNIKDIRIQLIGAAFFALNPIFLGNLAKVGLILAAALLPLCLLFIKKAFETRRFRYLLPYIACLNISFIHPYTFALNVMLSGAYFAYLAWQHRKFVVRNLHKFALVVVFALLVNAYFIVGIASMGSLSKDIISANVVPTAIDYTALVNMSNTGDLFTGLSLSKGVFLDFNFYNDAYKNIYFVGIFAFYVLLVGMYLQVQKVLNRTDKRRLSYFILLFLVFIALAATTIWNLDVFIKMLISLPGGWAFRSPLKWQLYIPFVLFGALVILLSRVKNKDWFHGYLAGLVVVFFLMNGFIATDVYNRLLVPRQLKHFSALHDLKLQHKTLLFMNSPECMDFMRLQPDMVTELNQVFTADDIQVKRVFADSADGINLGSYNYVLNCKENAQMAQTLQDDYDFKRQNQFFGSSFTLYKNPRDIPYIFTPSIVFGVDNNKDIAGKYAFARQVYGDSVQFVEADDATPHLGVKDVFDDVSTGSIQQGKVALTASPVSSGAQKLYFMPHKEPLYVHIQGESIAIAKTPQPGNTLVAPNQRIGMVELPGERQYEVSYNDSRFSYRNQITNPSFEQGLWQRTVSDCYKYDNSPDIAMKQTTSAADGTQALQLEARRHVACTSAKEIEVSPGQQYLLNLQYLSANGAYAGVRFSFDNDENTSLTYRLQQKATDWQKYGRIITVPEGATSLKLTLYAYPDAANGTKTTVLYDNVQLISVPPLQRQFFLTNDAHAARMPPADLSYKVVNPTKQAISVQGATQPFFVASSDTYNKSWSLYPASSDSVFPSKVIPLGIKHVKLNGTMNGWLVDPVVVCKTTSSCQKAVDGSYTMQLTMQFVPQQWFHLGLVVSGMTLLAGIGYYSHSYWRDRRPARVKWRAP